MRKTPADWTKSLICCIYKRKEDILHPNNYRKLKILEHSFKIFERVTKQKLKLIVEENIDATQRGFMLARSTNHAIFSLRQTIEKHRIIKKSMVCLFVDLEKAFDTVRHNTVWWALRHLNVPEWLVQTIQCIYDRSLSFVKIKNAAHAFLSKKCCALQHSVAQQRR